MPKQNEDPIVFNEEEAQEANGTLYAIAMDAIKDCIAVYLALAEQTKAFNALKVEHLKNRKGTSGGLRRHR